MHTDILIIGAGLAGLTCAKALKARDFRVLVLEAEKHIGGRATSLRLPHGAMADIGAHWLHGEDNPLKAICDEYTIAYAESENDVIIYQHGQRQGEREKDWLESAVDQQKADAVKSGKLSDCALPELAKNVEARATLERFSLMWNGLEPPLYPSAREFLTDKSTPGGVQPKGGITQLPERLAENVGWDSIKLGVPVARIVQTVEGVRVEAENGETWQARKVVFTGSLGVLKSGRVEFTPPLSEAMQTYLGGIAMGEMNKIIIEISPDFFKQRGIDADMAFLLLDHEPPHFCHVQMGAHPLVSLYISGDKAREVEAYPAEAALAYMKEVLGPVKELAGFEAHIMGQPVITHWAGSPYTQGAYSSCLPGGVRSGPWIEGNVIFCGDTFDREYPASMAGAYRSGLAAAEMIQL